MTQQITSNHLSIIAATAVAAASATTASAQIKPQAPFSVSISGVAFVDDTGDEDCRVGRGAGFSYFVADAEASVEDCDLVAGIQFQDSAHEGARVHRAR